MKPVASAHKTPLRFFRHHTLYFMPIHFHRPPFMAYAVAKEHKSFIDSYADGTTQSCVSSGQPLQNLFHFYQAEGKHGWFVSDFTVNEIFHFSSSSPAQHCMLLQWIIRAAVLSDNCAVSPTAL